MDCNAAVVIYEAQLAELASDRSPPGSAGVAVEGLTFKGVHRRSFRLVSRQAHEKADLIDQLFNSSEKRLARLLLLLANFGKESNPEPMIAKISQETLAQMIGTTRARVSFFMNKFRKLGFISYNGGIEVHSSLLNAVLHDQPHIER